MSSPSVQTVRKVCSILAKNYPISMLGNKKNPLDEYLYIILSLRTHRIGLETSYRRFKKMFPSWENAYEASRKEIEEEINPGGLAEQKADRIKKALELIKEKFGEVSLRKLKCMQQQETKFFLMELPGVGLKSAYCIMMYSLGYNVLPIDIHVARISQRLGWLEGSNSENLQLALEQIIPPKLRYSYHVLCVQHGRAICKGQYPKCQKCSLIDICLQIVQVEL